MPIATTIMPTMNGARFEPTGELYSSVIAQMNSARKKVPTIWSISGPRTLWKYGAGNVANVLYVASEAGVPLDDKQGFAPAEHRGAVTDLVQVVDRVVVDQEDQGGADEGAEHLRAQ